MALTRNNYYMPTCACVLEQEYDTTDYAGTMRWTAIKRRCAQHPGLFDLDLPAVVYAEMLRASKFQNKVVEQGGTVTWPDGQMAKAYSGLDNARVLSVAVTGLNATKKLDVQTWANTEFGVGKVAIL